MVNLLSQQTSIFNQYITEIRDVTIQKDAMRFRKNLERMGEIFAYEISKTMDYKDLITTTQLGEANGKGLKEQPVVATILRAGLPMHTGMLNVFDQAQNAFVSAYRKNNHDHTFDVQIEYISSPNINDKILIITDPMIATGSSMVLAYRALLTKGIPKHTHIVSLISSKEGLAHVKSKLPIGKYTFWLGAIDEELTAHYYIVPGLGDAGDLAFGGKM